MQAVEIQRVAMEEVEVLQRGENWHNLEANWKGFPLFLVADLIVEHQSAIRLILRNKPSTLAVYLNQQYSELMSMHAPVKQLSVILVVQEWGL